MKFVTVLMVAACSLICVARADAQNFSMGTNPIDLTASISNPAPGQSVTITARGYGMNINAATVTWASGGKVIGKGIGLTSVVVSAPAPGKRVTVSVTAVSPDGATNNSSIVLGSGSIDMIIEPDGYVPPFFAGKAPVAYQNSVKVTAVPHLSNAAGVEYDPASLVYQWKQNSTALQDQSGYAAQSITLAGTLVPRQFTVSVTVSTRDGSAQTSGLISVTPEAPSISFYRNDPLYGPLYDTAIGSSLYLGSQRETGVVAVPFGFNAAQGGGLAFTWLINSVSHPELASNKSITLRAPDDQAGSSDIILTARNDKNILQQASANFSTIWNAVGKSSTAF